MGDKSTEDLIKEIEAQKERVKEPLFTVISYPHPGYYLNACLHLGESLGKYADGYKKAADIVVQYVVDNHLDQDILVYPIAFLYRQYLELRIKGLIEVTSELHDPNTDIQLGHDLVSLWTKLRPNIEKIWGWSKTNSDLNAIGDRLKELCSVDPGSYAFRYPQDTQGVPNLLQMRYINLKQLKDVIHDISLVLDNMSIGMGEQLKEIRKLRYEMAQDQAEMNSE